jgi:hypothetical protein
MVVCVCVCLHPANSKRKLAERQLRLRREGREQPAVVGVRPTIRRDDTDVRTGSIEMCICCVDPSEAGVISPDHRTHQP